MHDPMTVAHEIGKWVTIWHVDPEKDGSDDSCGWFIRSRHLDQAVLKKIADRFEWEWTHGVPYGWFAENGEPNYSVQAIVIGMFHLATGEMFGHWTKRQQRFLQTNLWRILHFAENNCDSAYGSIMRPYGIDNSNSDPKDRARNAAAMIASWIARADRPWWKHPRWHIRHWKIQVHCILALKRWLFSRCEKCGKGFKWGESPYSNSWNGTGPLWFRSEKHVHHSRCSETAVVK